MVQKIDITKLIKAKKIFDEFRINMITERDKSGAVKAFEFCYEMSWKSMKRVLASLGQETGSPHDTFRVAALEKIILNPELWFEFKEKRNLTSHTYELANMQLVLACFDVFSQEVDLLITRLQELI